MRKSILIVDDEPKVLQAMHRLIKGLDPEWEVAFADSGANALQMMALQPFDVVICDLIMPGMDGAQLLGEVMHQYPQCTRIVLCWNADQPELTRLYGIAHQYLFKPCNAAGLKQVLNNTFARTDLLKDQKVRHLIAQVKAVPSMPTLYLDLQREMQSDNASMETAGEIVSRDPGMSAKILQLVNSAYFGLSRQIASPTEAVMFLGIETIKAIVLSLQLFSHFDRARIQACNLALLWEHSWTTGVLAKRLTMSECRNTQMADQAFTGGLLHDIGKMVLAANLPELYRAASLMAQHKGMAIAEAERETFGCDHAEVGGYLLGLWGLPAAIVEAVAYHHCPAWSTANGFSAVTAVHVANALRQDRQSSAPLENQADLDYLASMDLLDHYAQWQEICWGGAAARADAEACCA
jgi:HD-like signal output (HDOD) protein/ActR/RegA family two-component response regulator